MDFSALILSRMQFAFTVSFHIIFPAFTIGLAAWLMTLELFSFFTEKPIYRKLFDFWLRIFAVAFGLGVVSGIVMAFQFGTNWSELSRRSGNIQGGLLAYESFTAFMLEAAFFGILIFGRKRVPKVVYLLATVRSRSAPTCRATGSLPTTAGCSTRPASSFARRTHSCRSTGSRSCSTRWRSAAGPI
jgi:cytochrome d ubiquinol oxidase subunit I